MDSLYSFSDCPNRCKDGYYIDPYKHKRILCDYCADKRKKVMQTDSEDLDNVYESLRIPDTFVGSSFNFDNLYPKSELKLLEENSVEYMRDYLTKLFQSITLGDLPKYSIMFNLGSHVYENNFISPLLKRAYMSGITLTPYLQACDLLNIRNKYELGYECEINFLDLLTKDLSVVVIDAGATKTSVSAVKGYMQLRASRGKPTIIFTNSHNIYTQSLALSEESEATYGVGYLVSISYKKKEEKVTQNSIDNNMYGMSAQEFANMFRP